MRQELAKKVYKAISVVLVMLMLSCACLAVTTEAVPGFVNFGTDYVEWEAVGVEFGLHSQLYYNDNPSDKLDIESMVQWIYNQGVMDVNYVRFLAHDGNFGKVTDSVGFIDPVTPGNFERVEADWSAECWRIHESTDTSYVKNGLSSCVFTDIIAGYSDYGTGGWECFWFPTSLEYDFHY